MNFEDIKWILGDIGIPILTCFVGFYAGKKYEKSKNAKAVIKGDSNIAIQNTFIKSKRK